MDQGIQLTVQALAIPSITRKANQLGQNVITPQGIIHSLDILQPHASQSPRILTGLPLVHGRLPLPPQRLIIPSAEPNAPPLENNHLDLLVVTVDNLPLRALHPVAPPAEGGFVVLRDRSLLPVSQRSEDLVSEREIVGGWLAAVLEERVVGVRVGESDLVVVGEVDVV